MTWYALMLVVVGTMCLAIDLMARPLEAGWRCAALAMQVTAVVVLVAQL